MITSIGEVMIYVENLEESVKFWKEKVGFEYINKNDFNGYISYSIAPKLNSEVILVLHDKNKVKEISPEVDLSIPSILFKTENIENLYNSLKENGVNVNEIVNLGNMKVLNFSDFEGNYFAVKEV